MKSRLALLGGAKAVTKAPVDRWTKFTPQLKQAVLALLERGVTTIGDGSGVVGEFETAFAKMVGVRRALAMNSGTATLHSACFAAGVGPGAEVIVPTYTWHASVTPILHCGATPVFCDVDARSLTADPADIERRITPRTRALCVVHVFGNVCDMDAIMDIVTRHKLTLIEDCSHAHGAKWKGRPVGSFGAVGCFSMQGAKAVSGGEAGVAVTDRDDIFDRMVLLGHFGRKRTGADPAIVCIGDMSLGAKYRPHAWAIAMANEELKRLPELNARRTANYEYLNQCLKGCEGVETVEPLPGAERAAYLEFKFKLSPKALKKANRDRIVEAMKAEGAPITADRYSNQNYTYGLLHAAPLFTTFDRRSLGGVFYDPTRPEQELGKKPPSLPVAEDLATRLITVPAYTDVERDSLAQVADAMRKVVDNLDDLS
ncbi:MAG TPA: DegT/DnrJ/EryC1/StrS family aminotransferase [Candidatus Brocadiia bacterium]|nr:DegT/DnrJ/EryC1/StrS family aminotransferase [Candidatus Brocadiia bacterium]